MGGGFTHLIMPVITTGIASSVPTFQAWRWAFFVPAGFQVRTCVRQAPLAEPWLSHPCHSPRHSRSQPGGRFVCHPPPPELYLQLCRPPPPRLI